MTTGSASILALLRDKAFGASQRNYRRPEIARVGAVLGALILALATGCQAPVKEVPSGGVATGDKAGGSKQPEVLTIQEGDVLKISFPSTPNLDSSQTVRRDGRITLSIIGEILVVGMTPTELEKELIQRYSTQLVSKEVSVAVVSSSFSVYITGAVGRPGKIAYDRPITVLEAIMEAGGFDSKADSKAVVVIRQEEGKAKSYTMNLKAFLEGKPGESFYLKSSDIVYVPEKFSWF